jgi:hypothetical protein
VKSVEGVAELAFGIAALVYAAGLALFRLPLPQIRRWGLTLMMHSWSGIAVLVVVGGFAALKGLMANYVSELGYRWALAATFDDAIKSVEAARDMALAWVDTVNHAALALGSLMSIIMLALLPAWISGVGVLFSAIASYVISAVFGALIFMQKLLAGVVLFMEGVVAFVGLMKILAPTMFTAGLISFMIPFTRRLGKTFIVMGIAFTLALPVAIVAASPPPGYAERSIVEASDIQALSIASKAVADLQGGVRYTVYDRENKTLWYPFLEAKPTEEPEIDRNKTCGKIPRGANYTCEQLIETVKDILKTPERSILDTGGGGYYNAYEEGYRTTLTNNTYTRHVWFLNMWITLHDKSPKKITAHKIPEQPDQQIRSCVETNTDSICNNIYQMWKNRWESFWKSTELYNETSQWMVSANRNSTFIWFTEQPWGTPKDRLDVYRIDLPRVRELRWRTNETYTCELDGNSSTVETCWRWLYHTKAYYEGNKSVYFVYLNMPDEEICYEDLNSGLACFVRSGTPTWSYTFTPLSNTPTWSHEVMESSFTEIHSNGLIEGYGPYTLEQSIQSVDRNQPLTLTAPTEEKKILVKANQTIYRTSYEGYPETPESLSYEFRVRFTASESTPYLPKVEWDKFEEDEKYTRELAAGSYVPNSIMGITINTMRHEWDSYRNFRQGLYRDGPAQEAARRINAKLMEYRGRSWETNSTIFNTGIPLAKAVTDIIYRHVYGMFAGSNIPVTSHRLLVTESGSVGLLKPLSELVGISIAMGLVIGLLAIVVDSFQALVGGQSMMVGFLMNKVGNISSAGRLFSHYLGAVQRLAGSNILGRTMARRMEDQMLKAALQQRSIDRKHWEKIARERRNIPFRAMVIESVVGRGRLEKMLDSRNPIPQMAARGYALSVAVEGLRDPRFKQAVERQMALDEMEKRGLLTRLEANLQQASVGKFMERFRLLDTPEHERIKRDVGKVVRGISQSGGARMTPTEWAEGFAAMMKNPNLSTFERVTLADSLARSNPGSDIVRAWAVQPVGKAVEGLGKGLEEVGARLGSEKLYGVGMGLESVGRGVDGHITAPAAFQIGATEPWAEKGVHVTVQQGYVPDASVEWHAYGIPTETTVRRQDVGGELSDIRDARHFIEVFGGSEDLKHFETNENLQHLIETVNPPDSGKLSEFTSEAFKPSGVERVVVEASLHITPERLEDIIKQSMPDHLSDLERVLKHDDKGAYVNVTYEVPADKIHELRKYLEDLGHRIDANNVVHSSQAIDREDAQPVRLDPIQDTDNLSDYAAVEKPERDDSLSDHTSKPDVKRGDRDE